MERFNWDQQFTFKGSNLTDFFREMDFKIFHLITLSKNKKDFPHVCNVHDMNFFLMWQSIYPEIRQKEFIQTVSSEDIYIIFLLIQYVSDYYVNYGDKSENGFLSRSDELFKWYHSFFPRQSFQEKINTVIQLFNNHKMKRDRHRAENTNG